MYTQAYQHIMKFWGFERGISHYLKELPLPVYDAPKILDLGCGTWVAWLTLRERFWSGEVVFTDIQEQYVLDALRKWNEKWYVVQAWIWDISFPEKVQMIQNNVTEKICSLLDSESFDIVVMWGVLGYSQNQYYTIEAVSKLLKKGGTLINLEMTSGIIGSLVGMKYGYYALPISQIVDHVGQYVWRVMEVPFSLGDFPAQFTRVGIVAQKD